MSPIAEILQEIKNKCDIDTYTYLNSFITVKLNGYRLEREETRMVKYEKSINEQWFKMFFIAKKLQGLSDRSLKVYRTEITRFITAVKKNLSEITTDDIRYYLACMQINGNCSKVTLDNTRRYLNTFFQVNSGKIFQKTSAILESSNNKSQRRKFIWKILKRGKF